MRKNIFLVLMLMLIFALPAFGQTALFSTTLQEAVDTTETSIDIAATTDVDAGDIAYVDNEAMLVISVDTTNTIIEVRRGVEGTYADDHANSRIIWIDEPDRFTSNDRYGACTAASEDPAFTPVINVKNGKMFRCTNSRWVHVLSQEIAFHDTQARDFLLTFDGNAQDFSLGLDDSADDLVLVTGTALGTDNIVAFPNIGTTTSGQRAIFYGENPATAADADESYLSFFAEDDAPAQVEIGRFSWVYVDVSAASDDSRVELDAFVNNTFSRVFTAGAQAAGTNAVQFILGAGVAHDVLFTWDGNATDFSLGLDDSADSMVLADEATLGTDNLVEFFQVGTGTSVQRAVFYGANPATAADNDESYISFFLEDSTPGQEEFARLSYVALDVTDTTEDGQFTLDADIAGTLTEVLAIGSSGASGTTGLATITADIQLSGTTPTITVGDNGAEDSGINFDSSAAVDFNVSVDQSAAALVLGVGTAPGTTDAIRITTGPAVAIVDATLSIGGIAYEWPADDGDSTEQLQTNGTGTLTWEAGSSLRSAKHDITPIPDTNELLAAVLSAPLYTFHYNEGKGFSSGKLYTGVMADEAPWAVHFNGSVIDPVSTFGYTVGAIQALYRQLQDLRAEVKGLKQPGMDSNQMAQARK